MRVLSVHLILSTSDEVVSSALDPRRMAVMKMMMVQIMLMMVNPDDDDADDADDDDDVHGAGTEHLIPLGLSK